VPSLPHRDGTTGEPIRPADRGAEEVVPPDIRYRVAGSKHRRSPGSAFRVRQAEIVRKPLGSVKM